MDQFSRTELLIGKDNIEKLHNSKVAVFGLGGVGSFVVEGLARAGIGSFILVDNDTISETNINRQLFATHKTIGMPKVQVAKERILDINPNAKVEVYQEFFMPESNLSIINDNIDYVVDAIDTITAKIEIIKQCKDKGISVISCMGTGNKLDPSQFEIADIYHTSVCPLAKVMRKKLRELNIDNLKVLYSKEEPIKIEPNEDAEQKGNSIAPGSISYVPSVAGLMIAGEVIQDLIKKV